MKKAIFAVALSMLLAGCGAGPDIEIEWESQPVRLGSLQGEVQYLHITSLEDDTLEISGLVVNRGNCRLVRESRLPVDLVYGQVARIQLNNTCNVREVEIQTSHGSDIYEW